MPTPRQPEQRLPEADAGKRMPTVLIIDGSSDSHCVALALLEEPCVVMSVTGADEGLRMATSGTPPDLILLDAAIPGTDCFEVCHRLKTNTTARDIPVIVMDAQASDASEAMAFSAGAVDYIPKPLKPLGLQARVRARLAPQGAGTVSWAQTDVLDSELVKRTRDVTSIQNATILAIAILAETRDSDTGNHLRRTQRYVRALAWKLSSNPRFSDFLTPANVSLLFSAAPLHDIGKVAIPDRILLKPAKLTPDEFEIMKTHTTLGRDAIAHAQEDLGEDVAFLTLAKEIAFSHQEKWDGSGYPQGLKGDQIPKSARLMALADVYDALISKRVYKEPMPHAQAVQVIEQVSGRHFDPDVVKAFVAIHETFETIALAFTDSDADFQPKVDYLKIVQGDAS